jgi:hypothetical protein
MGNALQQRLSLLSGLEAGLPVGADFVAEVGDLRSVGTEGAAGSLDSMYGAFHRVLLLTAQRREEVAGVRWSELDLEKGTWLIPKERTKNGKGHLVHLSPQALACLPVKGNGVFVFHRRGTGPAYRVTRKPRYA